ETSYSTSTSSSAPFFLVCLCPPPSPTLFPYTTLFRSLSKRVADLEDLLGVALLKRSQRGVSPTAAGNSLLDHAPLVQQRIASGRSEEHTSELQSRGHLVCRLLLDIKSITYTDSSPSIA